MAMNKENNFMFNSKYSNFLTIVLVIVIVAIVGLVIFLGYDMYRKYYIEKEAEDFLSQYEETVQNTLENTVAVDTEPVVIETVNQIESTNPSGNSTSNVKTYKGFNVLGTIEIPKTGVKYPVLEKVTTKSLQVSVAYYYGPGLNQVGNTTIYGHNYRNGAFFGKNKQLKNGDIIYITDNSGQRVKYTIYNVYTTSETDAEYVTRDTKGAREISLSTCTDDSKGRLIIWAKE